jgi:hypothetical protein
MRALVAMPLWPPSVATTVLPVYTLERMAATVRRESMCVCVCTQLLVVEYLPVLVEGCKFGDAITLTMVRSPHTHTHQTCASL